MRRSSLNVVFAAMALGAFIPLEPVHVEERPSRGKSPTAKRVRMGDAMPVPGGGAKERARNLRRIASGQITTANGLEHG